MKVRKGGVVLSIPPTELRRYLDAGWSRVQEPTKEQIRANNERARLKRLKAKGGIE